MNDLKLEIIRFEDEDFNLDVHVDYDSKTVWLSQNDMALLFNKSRSTISEHILNIGEYVGNFGGMCRKFRHIGPNNKVYNYNIYNQDIIYKVGEKVKSLRNIKFKEWVDSLFTTQVDLLPVNNGQNYELIEFKDGDFSLTVNVSPNENTVWLTQEQIALLFDTTIPNINMHINNIYYENELELNRTFKKNLIVRIEGNREVKREIYMYNLEMIISIGFRVTSKRGNLFRIWANKVLKEYVLSGYAINEKRCLECQESLVSFNNKLNELSMKIEKIEDYIDEENNYIIFEDSPSSPYYFFQKIFNKAKEELIIVDDYADDYLLGMLEKISIPVKIYVGPLSKLLSVSLNKNIKVVAQKIIHDRFVFVDDKYTYSIGTSFNSLGIKRSVVHLEKYIKKQDVLKDIL